MENALRAKRLGMVAGACLALAACGSLEQEDVVIAGAPLQTVTTTSTLVETTTTTVAETTTTTSESAATNETTESVEAAAPASTSTTGAASGASTDDGDVAVAAAQVQDDDDDMEELPRTGSANGVLLLIAIGCAMIVGGRTLIDLMNAAARAIQNSTVRSAPPR